MLDDRLQLMVEELAERLDRSVIVDDAALRPLAVSAQLGKVDQSRIESVLQRRTDERIRAVIRRHGVHESRGPVRIPAHDELHTLARVVFPLRRDGMRLGFLWLIDDPALDAAQLELARVAAEEACAVLGAHMDRESAEVDTTQRLLDHALGAGRRDRGRAAAGLRDLGVPAGGAPHVVAVLRHRAADGDLAHLRRTARGLRLRLGGRDLVHGTPGVHELVVLTSESRRSTLLPALAAVLDELVVGLRAGVDDIDELPAAHADARYAAEVAGAVGIFGGMADWARLGPHAALQHLPRTRETLERLCPGVSELWSAGNALYAETARCYLDRGGNAQHTAQALHVHRTTLYWRLAGIERLLGIDLSDGDARLGLHLALRLTDLLPDTGPTLVGGLRPTSRHDAESRAAAEALPSEKAARKGGPGRPRVE